MMKRNATLRTPWSVTGSTLLHYPDRNLHPDMQWRDNDVFAVKLKMLGTERGRSAAFFRWEVQEGDLPAGTLRGQAGQARRVRQPDPREATAAGRRRVPERRALEHSR